ncbi:hypothetical protein FJ976_17250 [Mesorhizobium sp. B1-1-9]|uniref:hypothetical protein n=1 Tax=Mesorhizobium sp. B1-1-9 TaxID=2589975 RepID=UPI00112C7861|nr:hypothetical protein [Mesorhizobium sp. B1-1-9]TPN49477.1 hypothetical protein FJ976_17250 [Mesorhizobium sp. B1-1-9]
MFLKLNTIRVAAFTATVSFMPAEAVGAANYWNDEQWRVISDPRWFAGAPPLVPMTLTSDAMGECDWKMTTRLTIVKQVNVYQDSYIDDCDGKREQHETYNMRGLAKVLRGSKAEEFDVRTSSLPLYMADTFAIKYTFVTSKGKRYREVETCHFASQKNAKKVVSGAVGDVRIYECERAQNAESGADSSVRTRQRGYFVDYGFFLDIKIPGDAFIYPYRLLTLKGTPKKSP